MTSEQRLNQHVCEDDFAHAAVERAQGSACPRPRAAAAVSACLVSSSGTSAGARRPWRRPWRSRLRQHRRLRLHCRLLRRGQSRGKGWWESVRSKEKVIALWLSLAPMLFFDPPGVFGLKLPKAFVPKGVGEELSYYGSLIIFKWRRPAQGPSSRLTGAPRPRRQRGPGEPIGRVSN